MGYEDMNPLGMHCPRCNHFGIWLEGRWETAPGETCSYDAKQEYEREHGAGTVTAWPYFACRECDLLWRGTKKPDGGFTTACSPSPHAKPMTQA